MQTPTDEYDLSAAQQADLDNHFTYHPPTAAQIPKYEALREAGREFAEAIMRLAPPSADQSAAVRKVREAVMTANAAIACETQEDRG